MTATEASLVQSRRALEEQRDALQRSIQDGRKELAALRYAMLDGSRVSTQLSRGHVQTMRQSAAGLTQVISALLSSPLSLPQRRLANSLQGTLEGWTKDHIDNLCSNQLPNPAPVFQAGEFSLAEVTQWAFPLIQQTAAAAGIEAQTKISGPVPEKILGDAGHIGQLLTLLPESLLRLPETQRLGLEVSVEPASPGSAGLNANLLVGVKGAAGGVCERIRAIAKASGTLQTAHLGEAESGLAVCWQLVHAMGGTVNHEVSSDQELRVRVLLPVEIPPPAGVPAPAANRAMEEIGAPE